MRTELLFQTYSMIYVYRTEAKLYGDEKVVIYKDVLVIDIMKLVALIQTGTRFVIVYGTSAIRQLGIMNLRITLEPSNYILLHQ